MMEFLDETLSLYDIVWFTVGFVCVRFVINHFNKRMARCEEMAIMAMEQQAVIIDGIKATMDMVDELEAHLRALEKSFNTGQEND